MIVVSTFTLAAVTVVETDVADGTTCIMLASKAAWSKVETAPATVKCTLTPC